MDTVTIQTALCGNCGSMIQKYSDRGYWTHMSDQRGCHQAITPLDKIRVSDELMKAVLHFIETVAT